jgi:flagellin
MGLVINHNMPAIYSAYQLNNHYSRLAVNTERLSSGLRINTAEDDPAGFGIRELMRSEIVNMEQGLRNAADGLSLLQTAEGALAVIDEKLLRMRELAEQAATGTYTTLQRDIINSEYQAMAAEIDRIASATNFNGVKLLDGSLNSMHHGQGLKIHFGAGDSEAEDYYFVKIEDVRATTTTGLRVGGDAKNDIWSTTGFANGGSESGCCGGGIPSLSQPVSAWAGGSIFSYGYNWDEGENSDVDLNKGRYVAGAYSVGEKTSLELLIDSVNRGTQSRVRVDFRTSDDASVLVAGDESANVHRICLDDEIYYFGSSTLAQSACGSASMFSNLAYYYSGAGISSVPSNDKLLSANSVVSAFVAAVNTESQKFWAKAETYTYRSGYTSVYIFNREGGNHDDLTASDQRLGAGVVGSAYLENSINWFNDETGATGTDGAWFGNGGELWGTLKAAPTGYGTFGVSLNGRDVGLERDLWILNTGASADPNANLDINFYNYSVGPTGFGLVGTTSGLNRESFFEVQNASDGDWAGASIRSQSTAQLALDSLAEAISRKDGIRAKLGAIMNRLENTMTNLETMHESLQASESRISDVDVASEMTDFVRNQVLSQAAVSILSQANALPEMALSLLNG